MSNIDYEKIPLDVLVDDPEFDKLQDVPKELLPSKSRSKASSLPSEYTRPIVVPVFNQGNIGSCVGCSGKVVVTDPNHEGTNLSAMWLYKRAQVFDQWRGEDYSGTSIVGACKALAQEGICEERFYPYTFDKTDKPREGALEDALPRRIQGYYSMGFGGNVENIKHLLQTQSLWTAFDVHRNFYHVGRDGFLRDEAGYMGSEKKGGHAVTLVGWKVKDGQLFWRFQNSWGSYWGDKGFFYMSNDLFSKISRGVYYVVTDGKTPKIKEPLWRKLLNIPGRIINALVSIIQRIT